MTDDVLMSSRDGLMSSRDGLVSPREGQMSPRDASDGRPKINMEAGRRAFVRNLGLGAVGAAVFGASTGEAIAQAAPTPLQVLTLALNLEYLEAEFYLHAFTGSGLPAGDIGPNPGQVTGGAKVPFKDPLVQAYAAEIATDELHHVEFLRAAIASTGAPVPSRPAINIGTSFTMLAKAAGLIGPGQTFNAYANDTNFLLAAYIFEDVGVTAYHGGAKYLIGTPYLPAAAGIYSVEGYHAGLIRTILFEAEKFRETQLISNLRQSLSPVVSGVGASGKDTGVQTTVAPAVVLRDGVGLAFERDTRGVLNVVYGKANATSGLFFPAGVNGL